jgi:hypothetical protein
MNMPSTPPPPPKKGMGPLAWVGIGCLVVVVLGLGTCYALGRMATNKLKEYTDDPNKIAMTAAKLVIKANPDVELVASDDAAQTLTIRNKKTGEQFTVSVADIRDGKLSFEGPDGTSSISIGDGSITASDAEGRETAISLPGGQKADLPAWLTLFPGATAEPIMQTSNKRQRSGSYVVTSGGTLQEVADHYERAFEAAGLTADKNVATVGGTLSGASVSGKSADGRRTANVGISDFDVKVRALITYEESLE